MQAGVIEGRKLDKYIIRDRDYLVFPGNPLGNKSKAAEDRFPRMEWGLFAKRLDSNNLWKRFYRMSKESFSDLLALIRPSVSGNIFWDILTIFFFWEAPRSGRRRLAPQAKFLGDVT